MTPRTLTTAAALAAALTCLPSAAQSRPDEDAMFGGAPESETPSEATPTAPSSTNASAPPAQPPAVEQSGREETRDEQALSGTTSQEAFGSEEHVDDPLKIGGQFYLRAI